MKGNDADDVSSQGSGAADSDQEDEQFKVMKQEMASLKSLIQQSINAKVEMEAKRRPPSPPAGRRTSSNQTWRPSSKRRA